MATPRLRGLLALNLTIAASSSLVIVNTVVFVRDHFDRNENDVAIAFAAFGAGSMASAMLLPRILERMHDRNVMLTAGFLCLVILFSLAATWPSGAVTWPWFLGIWCGLGLCYSAVSTPSGRLLRRSADAANRPAIFAAQFALSHGCWLITYPVAGFVGSMFGLAESAAVLAALAAAGWATALMVWPRGANRALPHIHTDLSPNHPHLQNAEKTKEGYRHTHVFLVDSLHRQWPTQG